jgi:hypothetical protein
VTVLDTDLALTGVPSNITVNATSPSGAAVSYTAPTAVDEETPPAVICDHASGSTSPIGTTTVTCTATDPDDAPSTTTGHFNVSVSALDKPLTVTGGFAITFFRVALVEVNFTDADPNGTLSQYSATIDWGDHSALTSASVSGDQANGFSAFGIHYYAAPGTHTITVTIRDVQGAKISTSIKV